MHIKYYYRKVVFISAFFWYVSPCVYSQNSGASGNSASEWGLADTTTRIAPATDGAGQLDLNGVRSTENSSLSPDYTIKKGDCLWNLAFQFLGNPFQWPQIWQLNTYIKNPDLIYPGGILKISGRSGEISSVQSPSAETSGLLTSRTGSLLQKVNIQKEQ